MKRQGKHKPMRDIAHRMSYNLVTNQQASTHTSTHHDNLAHADLSPIHPSSSLRAARRGDRGGG